MGTDFDEFDCKVNCFCIRLGACGDVSLLSIICDACESMVEEISNFIPNCSIHNRFDHLLLLSLPDVV